MYETDENNNVRYVLGTVGSNPLYCFGINPSTAEPNKLDNTLKSVERIALHNGYDSWIMFNVYPKRDTIFQNLSEKANDVWHQKNLECIQRYLTYDKPIHIWAAWGNLIEGRPYLFDCLKDIWQLTLNRDAHWYSVRVGKTGNPLHPLYQPKMSKLESFDMKEYMERKMR